MDIQNFKYNKVLMETKSRLEREIKMVSKEIENSQKSCNHISVCLGYDGQIQYKDTSIHLCLLCRKHNPNTQYKIVDATDYKKPIYGHGELKSDREERLLELQTLTMNIALENPSITEEELIESLNKTIQKNIEENKKIEKKIGIKFNFR